MVDEKKISVDKQTLVIISVIVLVLIGFLVWSSNNKRDIEFQKEKLEQEKLIEEKKLQEESEKERQREIEYYNCLDSAFDSYQSNWHGYCKVNNIPMKKREDGSDTCTIPSYQGDIFNDQYQRAQEMCVEKYK